MPSPGPTTPIQRRIKTALVLLLCALTVGVSGCRKRTAQAAPPTVILPPTPEPSAPAEKPEEMKSEPTPAMNATPPPAPVVVVPRPKPAPTKPKPDPAESTPQKTTPPPQISPRLSPEEQAAAEQHTNGDLSEAEKSLQVASGRQLNAAQHDLAEKARGFIGQAHEAMRAGDWVRARTLAQKARVLSAELVNSL